MKTQIAAEPQPITVDLDRTALVIIDMQRDFLEPGGFGETLGNDVSLLQSRGRALQGRARRRARRRHAGDPHPRRPPPRSVRRAAGQDRARLAVRCASAMPGPMGRILVRGEPGHDIIPELYPIAGEPVIDKPGKGAFCETDLGLTLRNCGIDNLDRLRRHHRSLRQHHGARGQRPRLPLHRARRLLRLVFPGIPRDGPEDDQGAGRNLRLGFGFERTCSRLSPARPRRALRRSA